MIRSLSRGFFNVFLINISFIQKKSCIKTLLGCRMSLNSILVVGKSVRVDSFLKIILRDKAKLALNNRTIICRFSEITIAEGSSLLVGENCYIGKNCNIRARGNITIGANTQIAQNVTIVSGQYKSTIKEVPIKNQGFRSAPIIIGDNVWIGANAVIMPGVIIGEGAIIGAGSIVTKNIESYTVNGGVPCRKIKSR